MKEIIPILYGKAGYSESYKRYIFCKEFKWDFYTYENQPAEFIEEMLIIINQSAQAEKKLAEQEEQSAKAEIGR